MILNLLLSSLTKSVLSFVPPNVPLNPLMSHHVQFMTDELDFGRTIASVFVAN